MATPIVVRTFGATGLTTAVVPIPTVSTNGNLFVAFVAGDNYPSGATITPPAGWTELPLAEGGLPQTGLFGWVGYKFYNTAADGTGLNFTASVANVPIVVSVFEVSGANSGTPIDITQMSTTMLDSAPAYTVTTPGGTASAANELLLFFGAATGNNGNVTLSSGLTLALDQSATNASGFALVQGSAAYSTAPLPSTTVPSNSVTWAGTSYTSGNNALWATQVVLNNPTTVGTIVSSYARTSPAVINGGAQTQIAFAPPAVPGNLLVAAVVGDKTGTGQVITPPAGWTEIPSAEITTTPFAPTLMVDGPTTYLQLADTSGTTAAAYAGTSVTGTYNGGFTLAQTGGTTDGVKAVTLNGTTGYITTNPTIANAGLTVGIWVKFNTLTGNPRIICNEHTDFSNLGFQLWYDSTSVSLKWAVATNNGTGTANWASPGIVTGTWYFMVGTFDGNTINLQVNGVSVATASVVAGSTIVASASPINIGRGTNNLDFASITAQHFFYENHNVSTAHIAALYNAGLAGAELFDWVGYKFFVSGDNYTWTSNTAGAFALAIEEVNTNDATPFSVAVHGQANPTAAPYTVATGAATCAVGDVALLFAAGAATSVGTAVPLQDGSASQVAGAGTAINFSGLATTAGDAQIVSIFAGNVGATSPTVTAPANFSLVTSKITGTSGSDAVIYVYQATTSLVANPTFTLSVSTNFAAIAAAYLRVSASPVEASQSAGAGVVQGTVSNAPAITPAGANDYFLAFYGRNDLNAVATPPAGYTELNPTGGVSNNIATLRAYGLANPPLTAQQPGLVWSNTGNITVAAAYVVLKPTTSSSTINVTTPAGFTLDKQIDIADGAGDKVVIAAFHMNAKTTTTTLASQSVTFSGGSFSGTVPITAAQVAISTIPTVTGTPVSKALGPETSPAMSDGISVAISTRVAAPEVVPFAEVSASVSKGAGILSVSPGSLTFLTAGAAAQTLNISEAGYSSGFTIGSNNNAVVTVSATTLAGGSGSITCTPHAGGSASVTVSDNHGGTVIVPISVYGNIGVSPTALNFNSATDAAKTLAITETAYPGAFTAVSSNTVIAIVSVSGTTATVTPKAVGSCNITLSDDHGGSVLATVTVGTLVPVISPASMYLDTEGNTFRLTAEDGSELIVANNLTFSSVSAPAQNITISEPGYAGTWTLTNSDPTVVSVSLVNQTVVVTPAGVVGTSIIRITDSGGKQATAVVAVLGGISVNPPSLSFNGSNSAAQNVVVSEPNYGGIFTAVSSNTAIATATVNSNVVSVTPHAIGNCTITITDDHSGSVSVAVAISGNITVTPTSLSFSNATAPSKTLTVSEPGYTGVWTVASTNTSVATTSVSGSTVTVTPHQIGQATVTITDSSGVTAAVTILVNGTLTISPTSLMFNGTGVPSQTIAIVEANYNGSFTAFSANATIASVTVASGTATVTPQAIGNTTITINDDHGGSAIATINVAGTIVPNPTFLNFPLPNSPNQTITVTESGYSGSFIASTDNPAIAQVISVVGNVITVKPIAAGSANITISDTPGTVVLVPVNVASTFGPLVANPTTLTFPGISAAQTLTISEGNYNGTFTAVSSNTGIATVVINGSVATVTPVQLGSCNITISDNHGGSKLVPVQVAGQITVNPNSLVFAGPGTPNQTLTITEPNYSGVFGAVSQNTAIATIISIIGSTVTVHAVAPGSTTVTISDNLNDSVVISVTVQSSVPGSLSAIPNTIVFSSISAPGQSFNISEANYNGTFSAVSADPSIATVSLNVSLATVTPVAEGLTTITVTDQIGHTTFVSINVDNVVFANPTFLTFNAPASPNQNVTVSAVGYNGAWTVTSANPAIAKVFSVAPGAGSAVIAIDPVAPGVTTITATTSFGDFVLIPVTVQANVALPQKGSYFIRIFSPVTVGTTLTWQLVDLPNSIISGSFSDVVNGGSAQGQFQVPRHFVEGNINTLSATTVSGLLGYGYRVQFFLWDSIDPWYDGRIVEWDQEQLANKDSETITVFTEGFSTQLAYAAASYALNPGVQANGQINAGPPADQILTRIITTFMDAKVFGPARIPSMGVNLDAFDYEDEPLDKVIDDLIKQVQDNTGAIFEWWVRGSNGGPPQIVIQPQANPASQPIAYFTPSGATPNDYIYEWKNSTIFDYKITNRGKDMANQIALYGGRLSNGPQIYGAFQDPTSISLYGLRQKKVTNANLLSATSLTNYARVWLLQNGYAKPQGTFKKLIPSDSARAGRWFQIMDPGVTDTAFKYVAFLKQVRAVKVECVFGADHIDQLVTFTAPRPYIDTGIYNAINLAKSGMLSLFTSFTTTSKFYIAQGFDWLSSGIDSGGLYVNISPAVAQFGPPSNSISRMASGSNFDGSYKVYLQDTFTGATGDGRYEIDLSLAPKLDFSVFVSENNSTPHFVVSKSPKRVNVYPQHVGGFPDLRILAGWAFQIVNGQVVASTDLRIFGGVGFQSVTGKDMPQTILASGPTIDFARGVFVNWTVNSGQAVAQQSITINLSAVDYGGAFGAIPTWMQGVYVIIRRSFTHELLGQAEFLTATPNGQYTATVSIPAGEQVDVGIQYEDQSGVTSLATYPTGLQLLSASQLNLDNTRPGLVYQPNVANITGSDNVVSNPMFTTGLGPGGDTSLGNICVGWDVTTNTTTLGSSVTLLTGVDHGLQFNQLQNKTIPANGTSYVVVQNKEQYPCTGQNASGTPSNTEWYLEFGTDGKTVTPLPTGITVSSYVSVLVHYDDGNTWEFAPQTLSSSGGITGAGQLSIPANNPNGGTGSPRYLSVQWTCAIHNGTATAFNTGNVPTYWTCNLNYVMLKRRGILPSGEVYGDLPYTQHDPGVQLGVGQSGQLRASFFTTGLTPASTLPSTGVLVSQIIGSRTIIFPPGGTWTLQVLWQANGSNIQAVIAPVPGQTGGTIIHDQQANPTVPLVTNASTLTNFTCAYTADVVGFSQTGLALNFIFGNYVTGSGGGSISDGTIIFQAYRSGA